MHIGYKGGGDKGMHAICKRSVSFQPMNKKAATVRVTIRPWLSFTSTGGRRLKERLVQDPCHSDQKSVDEADSAAVKATPLPFVRKDLEVLLKHGKVLFLECYDS